MGSPFSGLTDICGVANSMICRALRISLRSIAVGSALLGATGALSEGTRRGVAGIAWCAVLLLISGTARSRRPWVRLFCMALSIMMVGLAIRQGDPRSGLLALVLVGAGLCLDLKSADLLWAAALFGGVVGWLGAASLRLVLVFLVLGFFAVSLDELVRATRRRCRRPPLGSQP